MKIKYSYNKQAEATILVSMIVNTQSLNYGVSFLYADDFSIQNARIFKAIMKIYNAGNDVDLVSVYSELEKNKHGDIDTEYLAGMITNNISGNVEAHSKLIRESTMKRKLTEMSLKIIDSVNDNENLNKILNTTEKKIFDIANQKTERQYIGMSTVMSKTLLELEKVVENQGKTIGLNTGFWGLDKYLSGLRSKRLYILAARPGMGKSALAENIMLNIAKQGHPVAFFSLEMSAEELGLRGVNMIGKISSDDTQKPTTDNFRHITDVSSSLSKLPIFINDNGFNFLDNIIRDSRELVNRKKVELIIIDHIGLIQTRERFGYRNYKIEYISNRLKALAKELDVPIFVLSQLNRAVENREDKMPNLSDLRDSGALEQDADCIMFLYRPDYYEKQNKVYEGSELGYTDNMEATLVIAKNRGGRRGNIGVEFTGRYFEFTNVKY